MPKKGEELKVPCADGAVKLTDESQEVRTPTSARNQFDKSEEGTPPR